MGGSWIQDGILIFSSIQVCDKVLSSGTDLCTPDKFISEALEEDAWLSEKILQRWQLTYRVVHALATGINVVFSGC